MKHILAVSKVFAALLCAALIVIVFGNATWGDSRNTAGSEPAHVVVSEKAEDGVTVPITGFHVYWKNGLNMEGRRGNAQIYHARLPFLSAPCATGCG